MTADEDCYPPTDYVSRPYTGDVLREFRFLEAKDDVSYEFIPCTGIYFSKDNPDANPPGTEVFTDPKPTKEMWLNALSENPNYTQFIPCELFKDMDVFEAIRAKTETGIEWNGELKQPQIDIIKSSKVHFLFVIEKWTSKYASDFVNNHLDLDILGKLYGSMDKDEKLTTLNNEHLMPLMKKFRPFIIYNIHNKGFDSTVEMDFYDKKGIEYLMKNQHLRDVRFLKFFKLDEETMNEVIMFLVKKEYIESGDIPLRYINTSLLKELGHPISLANEELADILKNIVNILAKNQE